MLLGVYLQQEEGTKITANSISPGPIATNLFRYHSLIDGNSFYFGALSVRENYIWHYMLYYIFGPYSFTSIFRFSRLG